MHFENRTKVIKIDVHEGSRDVTLFKEAVKHKFEIDGTVVLQVLLIKRFRSYNETMYLY